MKVTHKGRRQKGNEFERECVKTFQRFGHKAERMWGSNGKTRGLPEEVDILVDNVYRYQCKRVAKLPKWLSLEHVNGVITREDNGTACILIPLNAYLLLAKKAHMDLSTTSGSYLTKQMLKEELAQDQERSLPSQPKTPFGSK